MPAIIIRIPAWIRKLLAVLPRWEETPVAAGSQVVRHAHDFIAFYFTFGIRYLDSGGTLRALPPASIVIIPARVVHGWIGSTTGADATIGHFHPGHPAHVIKAVAAEAV